MNGELTLAKRYAAAYINLYDNDLDLHTSERCEQAASFLRANPSVLLLLKLSIIPACDQRQCLAALFQKYQLPETLLRLVDLLSEQNRLRLLPHVLFQINELYKIRHGIVNYKLTSSEGLDAQARAIILGFLEKHTGKKIIATEKIDPSLIAGIRLQSDTTLWEYSIQKQLRELQHHFNV